MKYRYKYKTEIFKIELKSDKTLDDVLNEFGKDGWEVYSIEKQNYYDPNLSIGKYQIHTANVYTVGLKQLYLN